MMEVVRCKTKEEAKKSAGKKLNQLFLSHQHVPVLFLSSGGSALQLLDEIDVNTLPEDFAVGMLDERLEVELKDTNSEQFRAAPLYTMLQARHVPFAGLGNTSTRKIIITQGVGVDGHTAGILPFPENSEVFHKLFESKDKPLVEYEAKGTSAYPHRATVTLPFLRERVDHSVVYMVGEEKRSALERILAKDGALHETPARIVREMRDATIFTDIQSE
ncbi:MAG: 6-phosphogluconolactonase [bacterium]|nr:6-phosphogluconolactonase [bacterium]